MFHIIHNLAAVVWQLDRHTVGTVQDRKHKKLCPSLEMEASQQRNRTGKPESNLQ